LDNKQKRSIKTKDVEEKRNLQQKMYRCKRGNEKKRFILKPKIICKEKKGEGGLG
jgi:hypothetical protein